MEACDIAWRPRRTRLGWGGWSGCCWVAAAAKWRDTRCGPCLERCTETCCVACHACRLLSAVDPTGPALQNLVQRPCSSQGGGSTASRHACAPPGSTRVLVLVYLQQQQQHRTHHHAWSGFDQMLDKLRITFGELLHVEERTSGPSIAFHRFPTIKELAGIDEAQLRAMSFGYRAKFIVQTAAKLDALGGEAYLYSLRGKDHQAVQEALLQFTGVGRKVADCVALFSLDQTCAVPVDTHVWQIAKRDFAAASSLDSSTKTLTPKVYQRIHEAFSSTFGPHAGWAHCLLFAAELPSFSGEDARTKKGGKKKRTTGESESGCTKAHKPTAKRAGGVKVEAGTTERATKAGKGKNVASKLDTKGTRASVKNEGAGASQPATPRAAAGTKRKRKVNGTNREVSKTSSNRGAGQATQRKPQETKGRRVSKRSAQASAVATPSEDSKSKPKPKRLRQATKATT
eukprot:m.76899 g.76899  ORF g.76899 m.76899 type:complete len:457 (-) comp14528_c5_seq1:76-1446(-)